MMLQLVQTHSNFSIVPFEVITNHAKMWEVKGNCFFDWAYANNYQNKRENCIKTVYEMEPRSI